ncbi:hypothetical protein BDW22DRAFT_1353754 [Trametopsis cervina]|nr:hypothetical protein BDW22DRAFT_1353754 [Trametopsis cervina]
MRDRKRCLGTQPRVHYTFRRTSECSAQPNGRCPRAELRLCHAPASLAPSTSLAGVQISPATTTDLLAVIILCTQRYSMTGYNLSVYRATLVRRPRVGAGNALEPRIDP